MTIKEWKSQNPDAYVLHLPINRQWFDLIASGEKREEYREIKPHWDSRLKLKKDVADFVDMEFKPYTHVHFRNGYSRNAPEMLLECKGIDEGLPRKGWCPDEYLNQQFYRIHIGERVEL